MWLPKKEGVHPTRTIHNGRPDGAVNRYMIKQMNRAYELGIAENWTEARFRIEVEKLIEEEAEKCKTGKRALNKNRRSWSVPLAEFGQK